VNQDEAPGRMLRLVPLERPDQVPPDPSVAGLVLLGQGLLHPVLSDVFQTRRGRGSDGFGTMTLGDGDDSDRMSPSPDCLMTCHRLAHPGEAAGQVREFHSLAI
jgi:hypothetical protein